MYILTMNGKTVYVVDGMFYYTIADIFNNVGV